MAVQRQSTAVNFGKTEGPQIQGAQVGAARVDVAKFADPTGSQATGESSFFDGLLKIITPAAQKLGSVAMTVAQDEAYLRGSAAAGTGQAEAEVESNPMTRDWATAGYRDTATRLKAADAEAQTAVDMAKLREQSPAEFAKYLAARRDGLYSDVAGMSRESRKSMLAQQLVSERAAIQKHAVEHQAFVTDQKLKSVRADVSVKFDAMDAAKVDVAAYGLATANAFTSIYGNVWQNSELPEDARIKATTQAMEGALSRNHQGLFTMFKETPVTMPDGSTGTMFSRLPFDEQVKLTKAFDSSMSNTQAARLQAFDTQLGLLRADFTNPSTPGVSGAELQAFIADGVQKGALTRSQVAQLNEDWAQSQAKKSATSGTAQAWASGDPQALFNLDKSDAEGAKAYVSQHALAKTPIPQVTEGLFALGLKMGSPAAFKEAGALNTAAFTTLITGKEGNPVSAASAAVVLQQLNAAERERPMAVASFLSAFPEETQETIMEFRRQLRETGDAGVAAAHTAEKMAANSAILGNPKLMAGLRAKNDKEDLNTVLGIEPRDLWGTLSGEVASFFSKSAEDRQKLGVGLTWWGNTEAAEAALVGQKYALSAEFKEISEARPFAPPETRKQMALAAVAGRTINTRAAVLTLPRLGNGESVQSFFGVGVSVMPDTIGQALDEKFQLAKPGNRASYRTDLRGRSLSYEERDGTGALVRAETFAPRSLRDIIAEKDKVRGEQFQASHGAGLTKGKGDATVTYNGDNTVTGLKNNLMLEFRTDLVKYEGIVAAPKDGVSTSGKAIQTVGVGIATTNQYYPKPDADGKVSIERRNMAFMRASNAAAEFGMRAAQQAGMGGNPAAFKLLAGMSYQANDISNKSSYKPFLAALSKRDAAAAKAEFQKTAVWKDAGDTPRRQYYLDLIDKSTR